MTEGDIITGDRFLAFAQDPGIFRSHSVRFGRVDRDNVYLDARKQMGDAEVFISHNGDRPVMRVDVPSTMRRWYGVNMGVHDDDRFRPLPIGMENDYVPHAAYKRGMVLGRPLRVEKNLLYVNFNCGTNPSRSALYRLFDEPWALRTPCSGDNLAQHFEDVRQSHFVLSPPGNGLDCHRTWETLYAGKIPVVKNVYHPDLFRDLPVVVVDRWEDVTREFLESEADRINGEHFDMEKLRMSYWKNKISKDE